METVFKDIMDDYFHGVLRRSRRPDTPEALPSLDALLEDYIGYLMRLTSNNISLTARILKISRSTLYHRMRRGGRPGNPGSRPA